MNTKNILQLLIFSLFLISCSQTVNYDEEKEYFEKKKSILYYKGSPYSGVIEKHYKNGELHEKETYKEGKKDGDYEIYLEDGQLSMKGSYKDGERDGDFEGYYKNGELREKVTYNEGKLMGYKNYSEKGQISDLVENHGLPDFGMVAHFKIYTENGDLLAQGSIDEDGLYLIDNKIDLDVSRDGSDFIQIDELTSDKNEQEKIYTRLVQLRRNFFKNLNN